MEKKELSFADVLESLNQVESNMRCVILTLSNWERHKEYNISPNEIPELSERFATLHGKSRKEYEDYLNELLKLSPHDRLYNILSMDIEAIVKALKSDGDYIINNHDVSLAKKMLNLRTLFNEIMELYDPIWEKNETNKYALEVLQLILMVSANLRFVKDAWKIQGRLYELLTIPPRLYALFSNREQCEVFVKKFYGLDAKGIADAYNQEPNVERPGSGKDTQVGKTLFDFFIKPFKGDSSIYRDISTFHKYLKKS